MITTITITATVAILIGLEIGWRLRLVQIREHLAKKGYDTEKALGDLKR